MRRGSSSPLPLPSWLPSFRPQLAAFFASLRPDPPGARGTNYARGRHVCTGCAQQVRYAHDNPGRAGVLCCTRCLCAPGEPYPPPVSAGGPRILIHVYRQSMRTPNPTIAFTAEAAALVNASWIVWQATQSGSRYVLGHGWVPTSITVTYERA